MKIKNTKILFKKMNILSESLSVKQKHQLKKRGLHSFKINTFHEKKCQTHEKSSKKINKKRRFERWLGR